MMEGDGAELPSTSTNNAFSNFKFTSIVRGLVSREYDVKCYKRHMDNVMKCLILQNDRREFKQYFNMKSSKKIYYERQHIYSEDYRYCINVKGPDRCCTQYILPKVSNKERIVSAVIYPAYHVDNQPDYYSTFLALTAHNWIYRIEKETGDTIHKFQLNNDFKFKDMSWNMYCHSIVLKSTLKKLSVGNHDRTQGSIGALIVLGAFPLRYEALLEIKRKVFGKDATDMMLSENLLMISHRNCDTVKIYSWTYLVNEYLSFGKEDIDRQFPEIALEESPPILFEVKTNDCHLQFGGPPWLYVTEAERQASEKFRVYSVETGKMLTNGKLVGGGSIEEDNLEFHMDYSGRIIFYTASSVSVFKALNEGTDLQLEFTMDKSCRIRRSDRIVTTSSGRRVKNRSLPEHDSAELAFRRRVLYLDYEDELDVLVLLVAKHQNWELSPLPETGYVEICCNSTGRILRTIELLEHWEEYSDHVVTLDMDILIHMVKTDGQHEAFGYSLVHKQDFVVPVVVHREHDKVRFVSIFSNSYDPDEYI